MKQTAVEWLEQQYQKQITFLYREDFEQAKEMEEKQIIDAYVKKLPIEDGIFTAIDKGKQYYNETFKEPDYEKHTHITNRQTK